jgi:hypothetical protein
MQKTQAKAKKKQTNKQTKKNTTTTTKQKNNSKSNNHAPSEPIGANVLDASLRRLHRVHHDVVQARAGGRDGNVVLLHVVHRAQVPQPPIDTRQFLKLQQNRSQTKTNGRKTNEKTTTRNKKKKHSRTFFFSAMSAFKILFCDLPCPSSLPASSALLRALPICCSRFVSAPDRPYT